jgi:4-amino-4-deoxy-L-arabinose transferase-like glycosyltransferase
MPTPAAAAAGVLRGPPGKPVSDTVRGVTTATFVPTDRARPNLVPVPWWWVGGAVVAAGSLCAATLGRYGFHRDELYFRMLPIRCGYVDQPPLTPLLEKASIAVFGDTPAGARVPAVLIFAVTVVLTALMTRELGGGRTAQAFSAWSMAFTGLVLLGGHLMVTATLDLAFWAAVLLCVARALLREQPRWWLFAGAIVGVSMYNKLLIGMLLISLAVGILVVGPRSVLRSRYLWAGVLIALVVGAPNLIYQATHHFPELTMARALSRRHADAVRVQLLPFQILLAGPPLVAVWIAGLVALLRRPAWRAVRAVPVAYVVALVLIFVGGGQFYYAFGLQAFLLAAGWVPTLDWAARGRSRIPLLVAAVVLNSILSVLVSVPLLPVTAAAVSNALNPTIGDEVGWPEYVRQVGTVYQQLPSADQARAVIVTGNYGEAGSIDRYGGAYGLPSVYSGQNELWYLGPPPADRTVVVVWSEGSELAGLFNGCTVKATMDNGYGVHNEEQGSTVSVCTLPAEGWAAVWPLVQHYD